MTDAHEVNPVQEIGWLPMRKSSGPHSGNRVAPEKEILHQLGVQENPRAGEDPPLFCLDFGIHYTGWILSGKSSGSQTENFAPNRSNIPLS